MGPRRSAVAALLSLIALGGALVVLAVLQYRWIGQLADAERQRMKTSMEFAANHFSDEFDRELTRLFIPFQAPLRDASPELMQRRFDEWVSAARDPRIVKMIWFVPSERIDRLLRLDPETHAAVPGEWTPELSAARDVIEGEFSGRHQLRVVLPKAGLLLIPSGERRPREGRPHPPPPFRGEGEPDGDREPPPPPPRDDGPPGRPPAFTIVALDRDYVMGTLLPDLTHRYFEGEYDVEIARDDGTDVLYRSDRSTGPFNAELTVPIYRVLQFANGEPPPRGQENWILAVRHRSATLDETVAATRRRNLLTTAGVLLVLAGSGIFLMMMLRRAETLRRQQLEFVAGVTHELNTPLAALQSAGQNLADGVTHEPAQVSRYGAMIVKESRRLGDMVSQVLEYAGMQGGRARKPSGVVNVADVVDDAVAHTRWLCEQDRIDVDVQVDASLPAIDGDARSLSQALQNLIANAVKYAGAGKWIGVRARRNGARVVIEVEDAGPGIAAEDARYVFEPFFRGRGSDRARGSGLGLTIVKRIIDEHGGTIHIGRSSRGGAAFTISLPERRHE
jgi:signal transduction histidine kinase